jgi:hypothetical protein
MPLTTKKVNPAIENAKEQDNTLQTKDLRIFTCTANFCFLRNISR